MQQGGCKTQDGRMTKKMLHKTGNAQSRATLFRHSAVLSLTTVLLHKLPNLYLLKAFSSICDNNKPVYSLWKEWSRV